MVAKRASWGGKGIFDLHFHIIVRHWRKSVNVEVGADVEAIEGCCLLACLVWLAQSAFLQNLGPPGQAWHTLNGFTN